MLLDKNTTCTIVIWCPERSIQFAGSFSQVIFWVAGWEDKCASCPRKARNSHARGAFSIKGDHATLFSFHATNVEIEVLTIFFGVQSAPNCSLTPLCGSFASTVFNHCFATLLPFSGTDIARFRCVLLLTFWCYYWLPSRLKKPSNPVADYRNMKYAPIQTIAVVGGCQQLLQSQWKCLQHTWYDHTTGPCVTTVT